MKLRYIFGKPGSGKTTLCAEEILDAQSRGGEQIYIVPEQFSLSSERLLLNRSGGRGLFGAQVLSFKRLAYNVFQETGRGEWTLLEDTGKSLLLRKVLWEEKKAGELRYYKSKESLRSPGFVGKLASIITEFHQYEITPVKLLQTAERAGADGREALRLRLLDLGDIFARYREYLAENYISGDATLDQLALRIPESRQLTGADVWIDGFKSFTPQEYRVLAALFGCCASVNVALTLSINRADQSFFSGRFETVSSYEPYAEVKNTVNKLALLAEDYGAESATTVFLEPRRYATFPEMDFLVKNYFHTSARYNGSVENASLVAHDDMYTEIEGAAREIIELTRRGYRYGEIGVILPDIGLYGAKLQHIFAKYNITLFIDEKRGLLSHPLAELCRTSLALVGGGYTYEMVFPALRTGLTDFSDEETDVLENYVLANGLKGNDWEKEWSYNLEEGEREQLNALRKRVLDFFAPMAEGLRNRERYPVGDLCCKLYDFIVSSGARSRLESWMEEERRRGDQAVARFHSQMWLRLMEILDKIVELLGGVTITTVQLAELLEAGLENVSAGLAPPTLDHVTAGDIRRSRLTEVRALFVLGMNEGLFPGPPASGSLLSDMDREALNGIGLELAATASKRAADERLSIYQLLTKPTERLYLSYVTSDGEGRAMHPATLLREIERKLPGIRKPITSIRFDNPEHVTLAQPTLAVMFAFLQDNQHKPLPGVFMDTYNELRSCADTACIMDKVEVIQAKSTGESRLTDEDVAALYGVRPGARLRTSVTRLESYVNCPFMYYGKYNLGLRPRKIYEIERYDVGNVLHMVLDRYTALIRNHEPEDALAEIPRLAGEAAAECANAILLRGDRYGHYTKRLEAIAAKSAAAITEQLALGDFKIYASELEFSGADILSIDLGGGDFAELTGRVDRLDILEKEGKRYIRVIDYKSGARSFSFGELFSGLQLQLAAYMLAFLTRIENSEPAAILFFNIANPIVPYRRGMDADTLQNEILKEFRMSGAVSSDMEVIHGLDREAVTRSVVIPVRLTSGGTSVSDSSPVLDSEGFERMMLHTEEIIKEISRNILSGGIHAVPLKHGNTLPCDYCDLRPVCARDPRNPRQATRYARISEKNAIALFRGTAQDDQA